MDKPALRAVFMGTPAFAATILAFVLKSQAVEVVAVYTQPDRPAGRGKSLKKPEVKVLAEEYALAVYQPVNFKDEAAIQQLAALRPDVLLVAAYGLILPQAVLDIPSLMPINVHASLLPKYRGAAPIQRSIMAGDPVTGITIMRMEKGLDTGPILLQQAVGIDINDTSASLHDELADAGGELLVKALDKLAENTLHAIEQEETRATYAAKLSKEDGYIDFSQPANVIHATIRGVTPWPGARFALEREGCEPLTVQCAPGLYPLRDVPFSVDGKKEGDIGGVFENALLVRCDEGWYAFTSLCPAGKKAMDGKSFYHGYVSGHEGARAMSLSDLLHG